MGSAVDESAAGRELQALAAKVSITDDETVQKEAAALLKLLPDLATHPDAPYFRVIFQLALDALGDPTKTTFVKELREDLEKKTRIYKAPFRAMTRTAPSTWTIVGLIVFIYGSIIPVGVLASYGVRLGDELVLVPTLGALGGLVSILARLPKLMEEERPNPVSSFFNGFSKPLIGAAFALFLYLLIQSQILAIDLARYDTPELFLALAFLAGFSERLVPDLARRTEEMVGSAAYGSNTHDDKGGNT